MSQPSGIHNYCTSLFYAAIEQAIKANHFNLRALRTMEDLVKQGGWQFLRIPVFINGNHEIALQVDFEKRTVGYGA